MNAVETVLLARNKGMVIPAFNIPYLPMMEPVTRAVTDENSVAIIQVARVEWEKFSAKSLETVAEEYWKCEKSGHTLLGLDHVPVIDEDLERVDYLPIVRRAIENGFQSVMIDGSRLALKANIAATAETADLVHAAGIACEGELGAVMGHEKGPVRPYEEIFANKLGFTDLEEAKQFACESRCDWISVAIGNIHGAVAGAARSQRKPDARLDIGHVAALYKATGLPLVLHGGSGIQIDYILKGVKAGIAKINIGTEIRQVYEKSLEGKNDTGLAREVVYARVRELIAAMEIKNSRSLLFEGVG
ncbi:MAG: class II fructose-bisphosphate aldolase [Treponema sp.]|nr:class II fructose-bisphosphate aldolase [Treponema sp.]